MAQLLIDESPPEARARYKRLVERVLRNMLRAAEEGVSPDGTIRRSRAKYCLVDVPADTFDSILKSLGIETYTDPKANYAKYYKVEDIRRAFNSLTD